MQKILRNSFLSTVLALAVSCEDEPQPGDAASECRTVRSAICRAFQSCQLADERSCQTALDGVFPPCNEIRAVSDTFDACLSGLNEIRCSVLQERIPTSCRGALLH